MKNVLFTLLILAAIPVFQGCKPSSKGVTYGHRKYLPAEFQNLHFGMSLSEFEKLGKYTSTSNAASFRVEVTEKELNQQVKEVTYYFDNEGNTPLYELIIDYKDVFYRDQVALKLYGAPNSGDEWRFDSGDGYVVMVWRFERKLVIAAKLKGTEWDE